MDVRMSRMKSQHDARDSNGLPLVYGVVLFLSFGYLLILLSTFPVAIAVWLRAGEYRAARFEVIEVFNQPAGKHGIHQFYASGQVDGEIERFGLHGVVEEVGSREELEARLRQKPVVFHVMYHPGRTRMILQSESLRVQPFAEGFVGQSAVFSRFALMHGSAALAVVLFCSWRLRRGTKLRRSRERGSPKGPGTAPSVASSRRRWPSRQDFMADRRASLVGAVVLGAFGLVFVAFGLHNIAAGDPIVILRGVKPSTSGYMIVLLGVAWIFSGARTLFRLRRKSRVI